MDIKELLKPCPFCGRAVEIVEIKFSVFGIKSLTVDCYCGMHFEIESDDVFKVGGKMKILGLTADQKWNRRAVDRESGECSTCKYHGVDCNEEPCKSCKHNHLSNYVYSKERDVE